MIRANGLGVVLGGKDILAGIDLEIGRGERVAVVGSNGSGKTTLFRTLLGLVPFQGTLAVGGHDVAANPRAVRAHMGYVPQRAPAFHGTLNEFVQFIAALRDTSAGSVDRELEALSLPRSEFGEVPMARLSGGMMQKALVAVALAARDPVLLLDEPTANLDPTTRRELLAAIARAPDDTTVLLSSHRASDIETLAGRIILLANGALALDSSAADVSAQSPATTAVRLDIPSDQRDEARNIVEAFGAQFVHANGMVSATVAHHAVADLVVRLRSSGIRVAGIRVDGANLEATLERLMEDA